MVKTEKGHIGNQKISHEYQKSRLKIKAKADILLETIEKEQDNLTKLKEKYQFNDKNQKMLIEAQTRIIQFKEGMSNSWIDSLKDEIL